MHHRKITRLSAYTLGALIPLCALGAYAVWSATSTDAPEIPEDAGTIAAALSQIMGESWQTTSSPEINTDSLEGYPVSEFRRYNDLELGDCVGGNVASHKLIRNIGQKTDGSSGVVCVLKNTAPRPAPILATLRDLDPTCYGKVTIKNAQGTTTATPANSDPVDIKEGDSVTTTPTCSSASLYFVDHSIVRLAQNTTLALHSVGPTNGTGSSNATLTMGEIWARVLKPASDTSYFHIGTIDGSVGVRGTSVWIKKDSNGTTALPIDSGKLTDSDITNLSGAITAYATGTHAAKRVSVPLMQRVAFNQDTGFVANLTVIPNESNIYNTYPFIRSSTLADLRDYRALTAGVGNLATISMTGSWLRSHDIYSGSVATTANGIKLGESATAFIDTEFTRSLPDDGAEKSELCKSTTAAYLANLIKSPTCGSLARIYGKNNGTSYQVQGAETADGWIVPGANGELDISRITGDWTMNLSAQLTGVGEQHLINIGSGLKFVRVSYNFNDKKIKLVGFKVDGNPEFNSPTISTVGLSNNTPFTFTLTKTGNKYTLSGADGTIFTYLPSTTPIQTLFVGTAVNGQGKWQGTIENIQITR